MNKLHGFLPLVMASFLVLSLPAHADGALEKLIADAKAEGSLMVYHAEPEGRIKPVFEAFTKEFGIKVERFRAASAELNTRFMQESQSGSQQADVLQTTELDIFEAHPEYFTRISQVEIPNMARLAPENTNSVAIGPSQASFVAMFNTNKVKASDAPETWEDIANPRWANGELLLIDPRTSMNYMKALDYAETKFPGLLAKIAGLKPRLVESGAPAAQLLAAGTGSIAFPAFAVHPLPLMAKKAPVNYNYVVGPELTRTAWLGLTRDVKHPNAGKLFLNFFLSDAGMKAWCGAGGVRSVDIDRDGTLGCDKATGAAGAPQYVRADNVPKTRSDEILKLLGL